MDTEIIIIYCICDDYLQSIQHHEDLQCRMSDAEVMTTALVAVLYFDGNFAMARRFLNKPGYIDTMLGKSRFSRRLHRVKPHFLAIFGLLAEMWKRLNGNQIYSLNTFPVAACDNYRIPRVKIYRDKSFHGFTPSKRRYFYGLKIHMMVTEIGQPVEFFLTPRSLHDGGYLPLFDFDIPGDIDKDLLVDRKKRLEDTIFQLKNQKVALNSQIKKAVITRKQIQDTKVCKRNW